MDLDYENLSKKELIKLLQKNKDSLSPKSESHSDEEDDFPYGQCKFTPTRGSSKKRCVRAATVSHGFCATHSTTIQARNAAKKAKDEQKRLEEEEKHKKQEDKSEPKKKKREKKKNEAKVSKKVVNKKKESQKRDHKKKKEKKKQASSPKHSYSPSKEVTYTNSITVKKNKFGNFEHTSTGIVFNPSNKKACGVQTKDGPVYPLKEEQIRICEQYGWEYEFPNETDDELEKSEEVVSDEESDEESEEESEDEESEEESEEESDEEESDEESEEESESESEDESSSDED